MPIYNIYHITHPDGTAHDETAVFIKNKIKFYQTTSYRKEHIQATSAVIKDWSGLITITAL